MRRSLLSVVIAALVAAATASAEHLDPQKQIRPVDQSRARAMLLRAADLPGATRQPAAGGDAHLTCRALDESDLTVTGDAESATWARGLTIFTSAASVYSSRADANAAWRRGTSSAGIRCLRNELGSEFLRQGATLASFRRIAFPRTAERTAAYRLVLTGTSQGQTIRVYLDAVILMHARAQAGLIVAAVVSPPERATERRLAKTIATRMAKAMRGA